MNPHVFSRLENRTENFSLSQCSEIPNFSVPEADTYGKNVKERMIILVKGICFSHFAIERLKICTNICNIGTITRKLLKTKHDTKIMSV